VLESAARRLLGSEAPLDVLPAVLQRVADAFGCQAAVALELTPGGAPAAVAAYPPAAARPALVAELGALSAAHAPAMASGGSFVSPVQRSGPETGPPLSALVAFPAPAAGPSSRILALIREGAAWDAQAQSVVRTLASLLSVEFSHSDHEVRPGTVDTLTGAMISASPNPIVVTDDSTRIAEFNLAAEALLGWRRDAVIGRDVIELLIPGPDRATARADLTTFQRTSRAGDISTAGPIRRIGMLRADGTQQIVGLAELRLLVAGGRSYVSMFLRDVTELDQMLAVVKDSETRFRLLSRLAPVGIVQLDAEGHCVFVNDRWCEWTGTSMVDALGRGWEHALHPDDVERVAAEAIAALAKGVELRIDCRLRSPAGVTVWVDAAVVPLFDDSGQPTGFLTALTEISARKQDEAVRERQFAEEQAARQAAEDAGNELATRNTRLRELDELKTQFLATVSHELRTPLTSIISFTGLILAEEEALSDDATEFLGIVERNAEQLLRLVGDLLLLSRLEAGVITLERSDVSVTDLVHDAVATGSAGAATCGVVLAGSAPDGPPVHGDKHRLRQVLDNLVSNAVKFTGSGGHATVTAALDGQYWRIEVQDEGIGIPAGELDQLFGRFFRASNARTVGTPGTGIGLSIVKTITEMHGGHVEVRSTVGSGTTFSVLLPVRS
jgi:PAS domain S-box-containing protein